ncbi:MAG: hypothetical protein ABW321_02025 [Polyangiales bacterium]
MGDGSKRNPPDEVATLASEVLARARAVQQPWVDLRTLAGKDRATEAHRRAVRKLVNEGLLLELGEQGRQQRYAPVYGSTQETLVRLGCDLLRKRARGRLVLFPGTTTAFKTERTLPSRLRSALPDALKALVHSGEAFIVKAGRGASYFILRSDLEAALAEAPLKAAGVDDAETTVYARPHRSRD